MADLLTAILLGIVNWIHLLATVFWIGGMLVNLFVVIPSAQKTLEPAMVGKFVGTIMNRYRPLTIISMIVLLFSGIPMTILDPNYVPLNFTGQWAIVILIKHIVVGILVALTLYAFFVMAPKVEAKAVEGPSPELAGLQKRQLRITQIGAVLGIIVLLLTGIGTAF